MPLTLTARSSQSVFRLGIFDAHFIGQPLNLRRPAREFGEHAGRHSLDFPASFSPLDGVALSSQACRQPCMKGRFRVMRLAFDGPELRRFPPRFRLVESRVESE